MYSQFFGSYLFNHNLVTAEQLTAAFEKKHNTRLKLGTLAINEGLMTEADAQALLSLKDELHDAENDFIKKWYEDIDKILRNDCYNIDKEHLYEFILSQKEQNLMSTILNKFFDVYTCCVDTDEQFASQLHQIDDFIAVLNKNNLDRSAKRWVAKKKRFQQYRSKYKGIFEEGTFSSVLSFMIEEFGIDIDTEKQNRCNAHKKTIKVKNKITNKIIKFDSIESCAEFFNTSIRTVNNWKKGATPRVFTDYKLLSH